MLNITIAETENKLSRRTSADQADVSLILKLLVPYISGPALNLYLAGGCLTERKTIQANNFDGVEDFLCWTI